MHPPKCKVYIQWMGNKFIIIYYYKPYVTCSFDTVAINCNEGVAQVK